MGGLQKTFCCSDWFIVHVLKHSPSYQAQGWTNAQAEAVDWSYLSGAYFLFGDVFESKDNMHGRKLGSKSGQDRFGSL